MLYLGIDPGISGGIVMIDKNLMIIEQFIMPISDKEIDVLKLTDILSHCKNVADDEMLIILEEVHAIFNASSKSTFSFGQNFGLIKSSIYLSKTPFIMIQPKKWQKIAHEGINANLKAKEKSRLAAKRLFPKTSFLAKNTSKTPHDGLIDAALIAYSGFQKRF